MLAEWNITDKKKTSERDDAFMCWNWARIYEFLRILEHQNPDTNTKNVHKFDFLTLTSSNSKELSQKQLLNIRIELMTILRATTPSQGGLLIAGTVWVNETP